MAILGTYVDRATSTRAGDNLNGVTMTTLAHSLATNPDAVIPVLRSVEGLAATSLRPIPVLFAMRGNGSLNTVGFAVPTSQSAPTLEYEVVSFTFHSTMR